MRAIITLILLFILVSCGKEHISMVSSTEDGVTFVYNGRENELRYLIYYNDITLKSGWINVDNRTSFILPGPMDCLYTKGDNTDNKMNLIFEGLDVYDKIDSIAYYITKSGRNCWDVHYRVENKHNVVLMDTICRLYYNNVLAPVSYDKIYAEITDNKFGVLVERDYSQYVQRAKRFLVNNNIKQNDDFVRRMAYYVNKFERKQINIKNTKILKKIPTEKVSIRTNMNADYFYLLAVNNEEDISNFVKSEIVNDFVQGTQNYILGEKIINAIPKSYSPYGNGYFYIFLVGVNEDWSFEYCPVGGFVVDNIAPKLKWVDFTDSKSYSSPYGIEKFKDYYIKFDENWLHMLGQSIIEKITWGNFEGNNYWGYPITFTVHAAMLGDLKYIILQDKLYEVEDIKGPRSCFVFKHRVPSLDIGDNLLKIKFVDELGNTSVGTINIVTQRVDNTTVEINNNIY